MASVKPALEGALPGDVVSSLRSAGFTGPAAPPRVVAARIRLAAPFRGDGLGRRPSHSYSWPGGYAITYTDGLGRLTVMIEPDEPVDGGGSGERVDRSAAQNVAAALSEPQPK